MKKIYYLSSCDTCRRILSELQPTEYYKLQDIKETPISRPELEELRRLSGSYEALFSKRARLFRERGLHEKRLAEADYASLLLDHYTFLKRPVIVANGKIFIGNSKKTVAAAKENMRT
jgi:arsenate reductase-like glutaredoxin family protein